MFHERSLSYCSRRIGYVNAARARGEDPAELLPAVHQVASLAKRWLLGTHQGSVDEAHLASYLNEFVFRFNRRRSRSRGMVFYRVLELAIAHDPVRYQDLIRHQAAPGSAVHAAGKGAGTHRAWGVLLRSAPSELRTWTGPVKWIPQKRLIVCLDAPCLCLGSMGE